MFADCLNVLSKVGTLAPSWCDGMLRDLKIRGTRFSLMGFSNAVKENYRGQIRTQGKTSLKKGDR